VVTREVFNMAADVAKKEQRSRDGAGANVKHPHTKRTYLLRSFVVCNLCGHRMHGKTRRQTVYYACQPSQNLGRGAERAFPETAPRSGGSGNEWTSWRTSG
jgi:recombinase-like zinc beta ribbon protein